MAGIISNSRFGRLLGAVRKQFARLTNRYTFDFWESMQNNPIAKANNPEKAAVEYYNVQYVNNPARHVKRRVMLPGTLCVFDYEHPKLEDVLDFWDTQPLVLIMQPFITKEEKIRYLGINLHLLPLNIRKLVLFQVFTIYKSEYMAQMLAGQKRQSVSAVQVNVEWSDVKKQLEKFGAGFAIRMYIPNLQKNIIEILPEDWDKIIYLPSKKYQKTSVMDLEKRWKEYVKKSQSHTAGESHLK